MKLSEKKGFDMQTRNNALALLDDLLSDEKNVSKILIIKHNSDELGKLDQRYFADRRQRRENAGRARQECNPVSI